MLPVDLTPQSFAAYPAGARQLAESHLHLLQKLPLGFTPFLLKEISTSDFKFPVEQRELVAQLTYLESMTPDRLRQEMEVFAGLQLPSRLAELDWVNSPSRFLEQISAHLWATHQMDKFRAASEKYIDAFYKQLPSEPLPVRRLGIAVIGQGVTSNNSYPLFRKLRRQGTYYKQVSTQNAWPAIFAKMEDRAQRAPVPYAHWYIDGGTRLKETAAGLTVVSYNALRPVRDKIAQQMRAAYESPIFGPEALRTALAQMVPADVGMNEATGDPRLGRFELTLLTEGSGTQIYSTTFVQWTAREACRRAQPLTLLAHFVPRVREHPMDELLTEQARIEPDPQGSLIDADMGAYYVWLSQQRLTGAADASFLAWFENHGEAVAIGKGIRQNAVDSNEIDLRTLLNSLDPVA